MAKKSSPAARACMGASYRRPRIMEFVLRPLVQDDEGRAKIAKALKFTVWELEHDVKAMHRDLRYECFRQPNRNKVGRKSLLEKFQEPILRMVKRGATPYHAIRACGLSASLSSKWLRTGTHPRYTKFRKRIEEAVSVAISDAESSVVLDDPIKWLKRASPVSPDPLNPGWTDVKQVEMKQEVSIATNPAQLEWEAFIATQPMEWQRDLLQRFDSYREARKTLTPAPSQPKEITLSQNEYVICASKPIEQKKTLRLVKKGIKS